MSGGLCPSRSTVYVANIPFSLTNNDLHKIMEKYGKVVKVTIVKDKETHKSKGVAFVLFLERESAHKCVRALNRRQFFGRNLKCSIARDNGRTTEFIRRKNYFDKSQCYECGETGHLSYVCPNNLLGDREPEKKKKKKRFRTDDDEEEQSDEEMGEDPALESLSAVIKEQQEKIEQERRQRNYGETGLFSKIEDPSQSGVFSRVAEKDASITLKKKKYKKSDYFSDEEEVEETE